MIEDLSSSVSIKRKNNIHWANVTTVTILSKIIKGSANLFSLCLTLKATLFKIQNNVCRQGPFEIVSYTDEQLGNINGFQKSEWRQQNPSRRFKDIREFLKIDFLPQNAYFQTITSFLHLLNTQFYWTSTLIN